MERQPRSPWQMPRKCWRQQNLLNRALCGPENRIYQICLFFYSLNPSPYYSSGVSSLHSSCHFPHFFPSLSLCLRLLYLFICFFIYKVCLDCFLCFTVCWEATRGNWMFCSPAQCGTWDEGAGSCRVPRDAVICDVPSGEQNEVGPILGLHQ